MGPSITDWENYIYERMYWRPNRVYLKDKDWAKNNYPDAQWLSFIKTGIEGVVLEDAFRDHFIEKIIKPNFKHWRSESQLFDLVAYRTKEDNRNFVPFYIYRCYEEDPNHPTVVRYLKEHGLNELPSQTLFPGEKMLYGFEIKTDSDNIYHFLDQLPRYAWLFDRVILVIGAKQTLPKRLPSWVEVFQRKGDNYVRIKPGSMAHTFLGVHAFDPAKWYMPHQNAKYEDFDYSGSTSFSELIQFLKRCAISALFKTEEVEPYTDIDRAIYTALRERRIKKRVESEDLYLPTLPPMEPVKEPSKPKSKSLTDYMNETSSFALKVDNSQKELKE